MLEKLKNLQLHDQSLEALQFDFGLNKIKIKLGIYNDEKSDYDDFEMIFNGVEQIDMGQLDVDNLSALEIYSHDVDVMETSNGYIITFMLMLGFGKPCIKFSFSFKDYDITGAFPNCSDLY